MVKKIKFIEEEIPEETLDEQSYQKQMLEYQQAIDWKLWEMLKIMQRLAVTDVAVDSDKVVIADNTDPDIKPIIVEEDE